VVFYLLDILKPSKKGSALNRSRRLLVRWEKKAENYLAFLHLACAQLLFAKIGVFG
jgi:putative transposase